MSAEDSSPQPGRALIIAAFAAVYLIWGSTYLAIRYAVDTLPPFLMAGSRFFVAGLILFAWAQRKRFIRLRWAEWRDATIVGALLLLGGNGGVTWAEKTIPSSVAALMIAVTPLWIVLLEWREGRVGRPGPLVFTGLVLGFIGVAMLVLQGRGYDGGALDHWGLAALSIATITWAFGSLFSRRATRPKSPLLAISMQMIAGGAVMSLVGVGVGETREFDISTVSALSIGAWLYLMIAGALVGFTAYVWLLGVCPPSKVATYAFVNPLIAVALGCTLGNEPFSLRLLAATALIGLAVLLIIRSGPNQKRALSTATPASSRPAERPA
jgi:drug/metabolite transporter (DMT)-like permease